MELLLRSDVDVVEHQGMKRLLLVAERPTDVVNLWHRSQPVAAALGPDVETVLVMDETGRVPWGRTPGGVRLELVDPSLGPGERLDRGLLLRPLADQLVVLGRRPVATTAEVSLFSRLLETRRDLAAMTAGTLDATSIIERGGVFRPGLLVPAGGFADVSTSLTRRLESVGADVVVLSETDHPLGVLTA